MSKRLLILNRHEMLAHENLQTDVALSEDGMRTSGGPSSFEWWYFDAQFSDGSTVVIVFFTKPHVGFLGGLWPQMQFIISYPDGATRQLLVGMEQFDKRAFSASTDSCDVHIGPNWVKGDLKTYEIHAEVDGRSAHLKFEGLQSPWRPDMSFLYTDNALNGRFGWLPVMPYAHVYGELKYEGRTVEVSGTGYHDHNLGNRLMSRFIKNWTWGRANLDGVSLIAADVETKKAYTNRHIPILMLAQDGRILTDNGYPLKVVKRNIVFHPGSNRSYPSELSLEWQDGQNCIRGEFTNSHLVQTENILFGLPQGLIRLINVFYRPYYFRLEADLDLEIVWDGVQTQRHGRALYEMMLLD